jgi:hypothetical protein
LAGIAMPSVGDDNSTIDGIRINCVGDYDPSEVGYDDPNDIRDNYAGVDLLRGLRTWPSLLVRSTQTGVSVYNYYSGVCYS